MDADYKPILQEELPKADVVLWILKADALGTLAYDLDWIESVVLPAFETDPSKLVIGLNQIENIYDRDFRDGKASSVLVSNLNKKCALVFEETKEIVPNLKHSQVQPYSAARSYRVLHLLKQLASAAGDKGWILELISQVTEATDSYFAGNYVKS